MYAGSIQWNPALSGGIFGGSWAVAPYPFPEIPPTNCGEAMPSKDTLTERAIRAAKPSKKPHKLFDGGGLFLLISPANARYWRLKYRLDGKERLIAFGVYPEVSLAEAREARDAARKQIAQGTDPSEVRQAAKAARRTAAENTFEAVAKEWMVNQAARWLPSHARIVRRRLERDVFPRVGTEPISKLTRERLLKDVLRKVEGRGAVDTARRIRQYISAIMQYAIHTGRTDADPTPHSGALVIPKHKKYASITDPVGVGALMRAIRGYQGTEVVRTALRLAPLLFVRPGELRAARWREFDLEAAEWLIPAERMKMRRPHIVPLCDQALLLLRGLHPITGAGEFVFPSERGHKRPMSENTLLAALRTLGYTKEQMTPHGFRHMASTLLHESRKWRSEVIERQLAHADKNAIRAVYNAAEYLEERKKMMRWWANYLKVLAATN